jgi:hypothetical protein
MPMRRLRPLLVGMTPNPNGRSTRFLSKISGLPHHILVDDFERVNLIPYILPDNRWPKDMARCNAAYMVREGELEDRDVFLLGRPVHQAFFEQERPFFHVEDRVYFMPHPSGLCRVWNEPIKRTIGGKFLRDAHRRWKEEYGD